MRKKLRMLAGMIIVFVLICIPSITHAQLLMDIIPIAAIGGIYYAIAEDGTVWAWGYDFDGTLGDGTVGNKEYPVQVKNLSDIRALDIGRSITDDKLALKADGTVWQWGQHQKTPVPVEGLTDIVAISNGGSSYLALKSDGTVWTWGADICLELQASYSWNTSYTSYIWKSGYGNKPVQVPGLSNIIAIEAANFRLTSLDFVSDAIDLLAQSNTIAWSGVGDITYRGISYCGLAVKSDGSLYMWGIEDSTMKKDGYNTDHLSSKFLPLSLIPTTLMITNQGKVLMDGDWGNNDRYIDGVLHYGAHSFNLGKIDTRNTHWQTRIYPEGLLLKPDGSLWEHYINGSDESTTQVPGPNGVGYFKAMLPGNPLPVITTAVTPPSTSVPLIDYTLLNTITDTQNAATAITTAIRDWTPEQKSDPSNIDAITLFAEAAISKAAELKTDSDDILLSAQTFASAAVQANEAKNAVSQALSDSGIYINRDIRTEVKIQSSAQYSLTIMLDTSLADVAADSIRVEGVGTGISVSNSNLKEIVKDSPVIITISPEQTLLAYSGVGGNFLAAEGEPKRYTIDFSKPISEDIILSLPKDNSDVTYQAITRDDGTVHGGKYNPTTDMIEGRINESGTYVAVNNYKDFSDIQHKDAEMQEAIRYLASKGVVSGTSETTFSPDSSISRAEIATLIVKSISKYDPNLDGLFADVFPPDWYFGVAGSARKHSIISGYEDNTFRGLLTISKDQIITVAVNTLVSEMGYYIEVDVDSQLAGYADGAAIPDWARGFIAIATKLNLITRRDDGLFLPASEMTRGDAAIIIKRLYDKLW